MVLCVHVERRMARVQNLEVLSIRTEEAEAKCASLERENGSLAKELAMLEMKVGRGEFDRKTTKVLAFR